MASKSARRAAAQKAAAARIQSADTAPASPQSYAGGFGFGNGFQGVENTRLNSVIYFPELNTKKELTPYTRTEAMRRARWFCANHGLPRRICKGAARMVVGTGLTPQPTTSDTEWNTLASDYFASRAESPFAWDVGGRYTFYGAQLAQTFFRFRDGDAGSALTDSETGQAMQAFYEGHQISGIPGDTARPEAWRDGVLVNRHNRAIAYALAGDDGLSTAIPASDFLLNYDVSESAGRTRGLSILHHALRKMLNGAETSTAIQQGILLANQFGYVIEDAKPSEGGGSSGLRDKVAGGAIAKVNVNGDVLTTEKVHGAGKIAELPPGKKLTFLTDTRPHPNNIAFLDYLVRDIAAGCDLSPEILWNITALGGANTRFALADAQGWIELQQQQLIDNYCGRSYIYAIAKGLKTGRLRPCRDPMWWKHIWIPPARITVDFGRDGAMHLKQVQAAALSYQRFYGWQGLDWKPQIDQALDEAEYIIKGLGTRGVSLSDYLALRSGMNPGGQPATATDTAISADEAAAKSEDAAQASAALREIVKDNPTALALMKRLALAA